ncbi:ATP-binding protein [Clostridium sp. MT-14]|uniref:ATP-binding protein n=1 Tax=Clostridium aromativorans TaxID=2836848 RepID=A0ABS8NAG1_9CLOT|nr:MULTISPECIES: ATP-binding protein [Clostridium]KAA8666930.1 ATP-binding protein [Clostridium sp. HV4-5-A1G]MCC9296807.1 ATP-binding protein [Clostridium aromativorans]CAB1249537.1 conserved hypothetical protein [Clostridiaceae bacterium BL-3]
MFKVDIIGRVDKMRITKNDILLPLYEAIVNSFQSIEELNEINDDKQIAINILRDMRQEPLENKDKEENYPIIGFIIRDNGIGFNDKNYDSFLTSDSTYKKQKGGKGIGRFTWLKTFTDISVRSVYVDKNNKRKIRSFSFVLDSDPIKNLKDEYTQDELFTEVRLENMKDEYSSKLPKTKDKIGMKIIEHCLAYFIQKNSPRVIIQDNFGMIDLKKKFKESLSINMEEENFEVKNNKFHIYHIKLFESDDNKNRVHYCANSREVKTEPLNELIPDLNGKINDGDRDFVYSAYVSGKLFDNIVNDERTNFNYSLLEANLLNKYEITKKDIETEVVSTISNHLKQYLDPIKKEKREYIEAYIKRERPEYRPLLKHKQKEISNIKRNIKKEDLDLELFKIQQKFKYEVKKQGEEFLSKNKVKNIKNIDEYKRKYEEYVEKENELGKSTLAEYIIHRKIVIDLLEKSLNINADRKYVLESYIHNLIFPMKTISDDIDYENHNLWLIDERLAYHYYLASDIKMKDIENISVNTDDRADILVIDNAVALSDEDSKPYNALTIIEFKRPMRDDYTDEENPINQVLKYTRNIRKGNAKDKNGRNIIIAENSPFYLYIIADITPNLVEQAENATLTKTPDGMGFFGYNDSKNLNAYIEIISYEKLLEDAKKRNRILFDKLFK